MCIISEIELSLGWSLSRQIQTPPVLGPQPGTRVFRSIDEIPNRNLTQTVFEGGDVSRLGRNRFFHLVDLLF